jgi:periplasmic protein TonB
MALRIFLCFFLSWITLSVIGQPQARKDSIYTFVELAPVFPGGEAGLAKYLSKNIRLSETVLEEGRFSASVRFIVDTSGCINNIQLMDPSRKPGALEEEVMRVVSLMPAWNPGRHLGQKVKVLFSLPVRVCPQE